jgi:hypothetical protein
MIKQFTRLLLSCQHKLRFDPHPVEAVLSWHLYLVSRTEKQGTLVYSGITQSICCKRLAMVPCNFQIEHHLFLVRFFFLLVAIAALDKCLIQPAAQHQHICVALCSWMLFYKRFKQESM